MSERELELQSYVRFNLMLFADMDDPISKVVKGMLMEVGDILGMSIDELKELAKEAA